MEKVRAIVLFGPPGSGKGTVGKIVAEAGQQVHLSTGDMFRGLDPRVGVGSEVQEYLDAGKLVPDELTVEVFRHHVAGMIKRGEFDPKDELLILDGIPRSAPQVELLRPDCEIVKVVLLDVADKEVLIERLSERGKEQGRSDDQRREVVENRLKVYEQQTREVVSHYPEEIVCHINGNQSRLRVLRDVLIAIADTV